MVVFIYALKSKVVILSQPFRIMTLLYFLFYLIIARYVYWIFAENGMVSHYRTVSICLAKWFLVPAIITEICLLITGLFRKKSLPDKLKIIYIIVPLSIYLYYDSDLLKVIPVVIIVAIGISYIKMMIATEKKLMVCSLLKTVLYVSALLLIVFYASFFFIDYKTIIGEGENSKQIKLAELNYHYQMNPIPITSIEIMGDWVRENTPENSLFLIPPEKTKDGFGIWSKRAKFFSVKLFPYTSDGILEWKRHYLSMWGLLPDEQHSDNSIYKKALNDYGAGKIGKAYENLSPDYILKLSKIYGIDYIITPTLYDSEELTLIHQAGNLHRSRRHRDFLYLYAIKKG